MGEPAEHVNNPAAAMFPVIRDNAIAMREEGLDDEAAAERLAATPMGDGVTLGDLHDARWPAGPGARAARSWTPRS